MLEITGRRRGGASSPCSSVTPTLSCAIRPPSPFPAYQLVSGFLTDPTLEFPVVFVAEVRAASADFDVSVPDLRLSRSVEDSIWEEAETVQARGAPDRLAALVWGKSDGLATREGTNSALSCRVRPPSFCRRTECPPPRRS